MSFLKKYLRYVGVSEVPQQYHKWCGIAAVAAAAQDHVWFQKFPWEKLVPNLYVFLIGPSGIGKNGAVAPMMKVLEPLGLKSLRGKVTAAHLVDVLAEKKGMHRAKRESKLLLVTPELAMAVGRGPLADDLVKLLTELYTGGDYEFNEGTRKHGSVKFRDHLINWVAGTTKEWLRDCISTDAIEGGFFGRVCVVSADYDFEKRIAEPQVPADYDLLLQELRDHLVSISQMVGEFTITPQAKDIINNWYMTRPSPTDDSEFAAWRRAHDMVLKLSIILSLCDGFSREIDTPHVVGAQRLVAECTRNHPSLVEYVRLTKETDGLRFVREIVKGAGVIQQAALYRAAAKYGLTADKLRIFLDTLVEGRQIHKEHSGAGRYVYSWKGKRRVSLEQEDEDAG